MNMTKLEQDIYEATKQGRSVDQDVFSAKAAAKVAKKYILQACKEQRAICARKYTDLVKKSVDDAFKKHFTVRVRDLNDILKKP
jgi:ribosomal protein S12